MKLGEREREERSAEEDECKKKEDDLAQLTVSRGSPGTVVNAAATEYDADTGVPVREGEMRCDAIQSCVSLVFGVTS